MSAQHIISKLAADLEAGRVSITSMDVEQILQATEPTILKNGGQVANCRPTGKVIWKITTQKVD